MLNIQFLPDLFVYNYFPHDLIVIFIAGITVKTKHLSSAATGLYK